MKRGPDNERLQWWVEIWGFGDKTDGTVIDCIQFAEQKSVGGYFVNDITEVEGGFEPQSLQLDNELGGYYGVEC